MEPKSIAELRDELGVKRIYGVKKGPDSVEFGEQWLDDLDAIVIDPLRTPNIAREFENIDYMTTKDGDVLPRLEDKNNHTINVKIGRIKTAEKTWDAEMPIRAEVA